MAAAALLAACSGGDDAGTIDAPPGAVIDSPPGTPDAPPPTDCTGNSDRLILAGAYPFNTGAVGLVTVDNRVIGVSGSMPGASYTFVIRSLADGDFDAVGPHDVAAKNLKFLQQPTGGCTPGPCSGFFALAGTLTVTESTPRYRATFDLMDLRSRTDASDTEGPVLPGTITGCVNATR